MVILMKLWVLAEFINCEPNGIHSVTKRVGTTMCSELTISTGFVDILLSYITTKVVLTEEVQERYNRWLRA